MGNRNARTAKLAQGRRGNKPDQKTKYRQYDQDFQ